MSVVGDLRNAITGVVKDLLKRTYIDKFDTYPKDVLSYPLKALCLSSFSSLVLPSRSSHENGAASAPSP